MRINVLEYLEKANREYPERIAYQDEQEALTFADCFEYARRIGSYLCQYSDQRRPIAVLSDKSVLTPAMYMGVVMAGCFYAPLGTDLPIYRIQLILDILKPEVILTDGQHDSIFDNLSYTGTVLTVQDAKTAAVQDEELARRRNRMIDLDPLYIIFTSGSSGKPKGVLTSHRSVIDYIEVFTKTFSMDQDTVFGNQAPLDYIAAIRDIYIPLLTGARTVLIPKRLFSIPYKLFEYINANDINTLCWGASALSICAELNTFDAASLEKVKKVLFTGSALPCKHLKAWQEHLPDALFVNHYGPTEITASCTYYIVQEKVSDSDVLPIGIPFENTDVFLLSEDGQPVPDGEMGEICVRGTGLALGYYGSPEKTREVFVPNPLEDSYQDLIYKTGDLGIKRPDGNLTFHGRKDFQIKHMGHRIELSEVEIAVMTLPNVDLCTCLYKQEKEQIWLFYTGSATNKELAISLRERLPSFMIPRKFVQLEDLPKNFNGKIDLEQLKKKMYES